ncbi:hypothetical protein CIRG_02938 [Coccidioides immitis RMSCC 2394]|uniref:Uncharacterized protein n=1 Tax=Coccidioides immitis RMSCC 2394 TaxID=404692 RepID=A0A0J6Y3L9_COCIT|nr:hypothetical protein CIRG_02938 [Coccidioides immitis RMSCC 2394]
MSTGDVLHRLDGAHDYCLVGTSRAVSDAGTGAEDGRTLRQIVPRQRAPEPASRDDGTCLGLRGSSSHWCLAVRCGLGRSWPSVEELFPKRFFCPGRSRRD